MARISISLNLICSKENELVSIYESISTWWDSSLSSLCCLPIAWVRPLVWDGGTEGGDEVSIILLCFGPCGRRDSSWKVRKYGTKTLYACTRFLVLKFQLWTSQKGLFGFSHRIRNLKGKRSKGKQPRKPYSTICRWCLGGKRRRLLF